MSFAEPGFLLGLLLIPLALIAQEVSRRRARHQAVRFPAVSTLKLASAPLPLWRRHVPPVLALAALAALVLGLAKPQRTVAVPIERASIVLVTDHSRSMLATDVSPNRLTAAKRSARSFLDQLPTRVQVGAVAFSDAPDAVTLPSESRTETRNIIEAQVADGATATGEALQVALEMLSRNRNKDRRMPSAIVLLSDGKTTTGRDPVAVAAAARRAGVPIFTVSLGTRDATVPDPVFGRPLPANPDPETLGRIAEASDGRAFTAEDAKELSAIYASLGSQLGSRKRKREITVAFVIGGSALLLGAAVASLRWTGRLP